MALSSDTGPDSAESVRRWPDWLPRVLLESALIVLSVLLALALDEWRQNRAERERTAAALAGIQSEVDANRSAAEKSYEFHRELHDTLLALAATGQRPSVEIYYHRGMFRPAQVVSTAWESARTTSILDRLSYALVLELSHTYARQAKYEELADRIVADLLTDLRTSGVEAVLRDGYAGFIGLSEDFANRERRLVEQYDRLLALLNEASSGSLDRRAHLPSSDH